jgi:AhpD family alkylhydroperoxidase
MYSKEAIGYILKPFGRRRYHSPIELTHDLWILLKGRSVLKRARQGDLISAAFRERLMLVVTEVNGCRYCSYHHAKQALKAGILPDELEMLLSGHFPEGCPTDEIQALLYAQHWAEQNAKPDQQITAKLTAAYGQEKADAISILLRMIRVGNLLGNTGDYIIYQLSFGRLGKGQPVKSAYFKP